MRQSPHRVLLLLKVELVKVAVQRVEDCVELGNLDVRRQYEPISVHLLLWRCRCLGISPRLAGNPRLGGWHVAVCPHL